MYQMTIKDIKEEQPVLVSSPERRLLENHASKIDYEFYRIEKNGKYISGVDYRQPESVSLPQRRTHC